MNKIEITKLNAKFTSATPEAVIQWAYNQFGKGLAATSSFQTQSIPLLHLISKVAPDIDILFLDTGFHFPETLKFVERVQSQFKINIRRVTYQDGHDWFQEKYGNLHSKDPDKCCYLNKVAPLRSALRDYDAWISGIRRDQSATRKATAVLNPEAGNTLKICPMVDWTHQSVLDYITEHQLPVHPLLHDGYPSIGCAPCTSPVRDGDDPRVGRWKGLKKTECGLHFVNPPKLDKDG